MAGEGNPHHWVTDEIFQQFLKERGVKPECELCGQNAMSLLGAGSGDLIGSLPAYGRREDGVVDTGNSRHIPVARQMCVNCGNIRVFSLYAVDIWKQTGGRPLSFKAEADEADHAR